MKATAVNIRSSRPAGQPQFGKINKIVRKRSKDGLDSGIALGHVPYAGDAEYLWQRNPDNPRKIEFTIRITGLETGAYRSINQERKGFLWEMPDKYTFYIDSLCEIFLKPHAKLKNPRETDYQISSKAYQVLHSDIKYLYEKVIRRRPS